MLPTCQMINGVSTPSNSSHRGCLIGLLVLQLCKVGCLQRAYAVFVPKSLILGSVCVKRLTEQSFFAFPGNTHTPESS